MIQQLQQPQKISKILPVLIIVVVVLAIGVGAYFYFTQTEGEGNVNILVTKACTEITDKDECYAREDCLPHDTCSCYSEYERAIRCGVEPEVICDCDVSNFEYCEDLVCDNGNSNTNSSPVICGEWYDVYSTIDCSEPAFIESGYYYDKQSQLCTYFMGKMGCGSDPPFPTSEACQRACGQEASTNTNTAVQACNLVTEGAECKARADCLYVDFCQPYTDRNRAIKCGNDEVPVGSCVAAGFDYCEDLVCDNSNTNSEINIADSDPRCGPWERGTCKANCPSGYHFKGASTSCVKFVGGGCCGPTPFDTETDCIAACILGLEQDKKVELYNGTVSTLCQTDYDCLLVNSAEDVSRCCPAPECFDYGDSSYVAVNLKSLQDLNREIQSQWDCPESCPVSMPPECPDNNEDYTATCVDNICAKVIINNITDPSYNSADVPEECIFLSNNLGSKLDEAKKYLTENEIDTSPGTPSEYKIKSVSKDTVSVSDTNTGERYEKEVCGMWFDCCYTGDGVYFDINTHEPIMFSAGDI